MKIATFRSPDSKIKFNSKVQIVKLNTRFNNSTIEVLEILDTPPEPLLEGPVYFHFRLESGMKTLEAGKETFGNILKKLPWATSEDFDDYSSEFSLIAILTDATRRT